MVPDLRWLDRHGDVGGGGASQRVAHMDAESEGGRRLQHGCLEGEGDLRAWDDRCVPCADRGECPRRAELVEQVRVDTLDHCRGASREARRDDDVERPADRRVLRWRVDDEGWREVERHGLDRGGPWRGTLEVPGSDRDRVRQARIETRELRGPELPVIESESLGPL